MNHNVYQNKYIDYVSVFSAPLPEFYQLFDTIARIRGEKHTKVEIYSISEKSQTRDSKSHIKAFFFSRVQKQNSK